MRVKKLKLYALFFILASTTSWAQNPALLPMPQRVEWTKEVFSFTRNIKITGNEISPAIADSIIVLLQKNKIEPTQNAQNQIVINLVKDIPHVLFNKNEAFQLRISTHEIQLSAITETGLFYGFQTFKQLVVKNGFQGYNIIDYPAFAIRGFMHDVGRSFISISELKRQIAVLSHYKINTFHWHLTEDIAWRLESKVVPKLIDPSVFTLFEGQFYTQAEARDLVDFCKKHHVLLIPEIDMPGHSRAKCERGTGFNIFT